MPINKGGRGKKSPYETTVIRIPKPIEDRVNELITQFHDGMVGSKADDYLAANVPSLDVAIGLAKMVLQSKKSARLSLIRFIAEIYFTDEEDIKL